MHKFNFEIYMFVVDFCDQTYLPKAIASAANIHRNFKVINSVQLRYGNW